MTGLNWSAVVPARRVQGLAVLSVAILLVLLAATPGAAQFACSTTPTDITCINAGTAGASFNAAAGANQNATTTNTGTAAGFGSVTTGGGNATATNSGNNTGGANGLLAGTNAGGNATATNSGSNSGTGNGLVAFTNAGGNAAAANSGSNFGGNNGTIAQTLAGGNATVTNSGMNVGGFNGLFASTTGGGNAIAINTGTNVAGTNGMGALANGGGNATVINSSTNISGVNGIIAQTTAAGTAAVINSGSNTGTLNVIAGGGGSAVVINSGSTGAVLVNGGSELVINSGTIRGVGGTAIQFGGGPDTLNLLAGSNIIGAINLIGANDTINFLSGNHNLTFNTLAGASVNGPDPFVVSGNRAAAIDPTPFGLADKNLMDFTRGISGILDGIGGSVGPSGPISSAFAPRAPGSFAARVEQTFAPIPALAYGDDHAMVFKAPTMVTSDGRAIWARGFGGERRQDPDGFLLGANTSFFGGAVGFDILARPNLRLGLFAGGGESRMSLDVNQGSTSTNTAFGGLYGRWGFVSFGRASFLDFALHGGGSSNATARTVNNNMLPSGIEIATASYSSSYISPELKYGINIPLWAQYTLTPSLRLRYVAGFFGGYTENGTTAPLTVSSRTIQDLEERGELKLTRAQPVGPDLLLTSVHLGAIGLERAGDTTVDAVLLGANLPFVTPGKNDVAAVVGGAGFEWRTREGVSLFGAGEAIGFSDQSTVWSAKGGVRVAF